MARLVVVAGKFHASGKALLEAAEGVRPVYVEDADPHAYVPYLAGAEATIIRTQPMTAEIAATAPDLRIVSRHGVGYDAVDVEALSARGIALAICGDVNAVSVAEHACMMILASAKRALRADRAVRDGRWGWRDGLESEDIAGRTLLQIGYGRIGRRIAAMMAGFGLAIRAHDPMIAPGDWPEGPATPAPDLAEALSEADIVSLSVPATPAPILDAAAFARMRPGTIVVNTARGGLIDEGALIAALEDGTVGAAGLDVFAEEPLPLGHPLMAHDAVLLSPHIAGVSAGAAERMAVQSAQIVLDHFAGRADPSRIVNRAALGLG